MNDSELDELLKGSKAPSVPASLRESVITSFRALSRRDARSRTRWMPASLPRFAQIAALGLFVLALTKAAPLLLGPGTVPNARYVAETENTYYGKDGSSGVEIYSASYDNDGREIPFSRSVLNDGLATLGARAMDLAKAFHRAMGMPVRGTLERRAEELAALKQAGCAAGTATASLSILNYPTVTASQFLGDQRRITSWMAPALGCFPLRYTVEDKEPNGAFHVTTRNEVLAITLKTPSVTN